MKNGQTGEAERGEYRTVWIPEEDIAEMFDLSGNVFAMTIRDGEIAFRIYEADPYE